MNSRVLQLDPRDNVLVALTNLKQGDVVDSSGKSYRILSNIPAKHKFVTEDRAMGDEVIMYGVLVGKAMKPIRRGEILTSQNLHHEAAPFHEKTAAFRPNPIDVSRCTCPCARAGYSSEPRSGL